MKRISILFAAAVMASSANAEFWDGNKLMSRMESGSNYDQGTAIGYVMGVADALYGLSQCAPTNVTAGQVHDMVLQYLRLYPAQRNRTADMIILDVLKGAWPCPERQRRGGQPL